MMLAGLSYLEMFIATSVVGALAAHGWNKYMSEAVVVKARADGREYVVKDLADKQEAAETLARLNATVQDFVTRLPADDARVRRIKRRYNPDAVSEGTADSGYTSYSVNKGERIVVCMRQADNTFVDYNDLVYVVVHELAHLSTDDIGHTPEFWDNFKYLIGHAIEFDLYRYKDYGDRPVNYCGMKISSTVAKQAA